MRGRKLRSVNEAAFGCAGSFPARLACLAVAFGLALGGRGILAGDVAVDGSWSVGVGVADLTGGAGTDLAGSHESADGEITLTVSNTSGQWRIDVRRVDADWPEALSLAIRRTSAGTGGSVSGGTSYLTVDGLDRQFITGIGDVSGIKLQEKIGGVSVRIPPGLYATTLVFTITEN